MASLIVAGSQFTNGPATTTPTVDPAPIVMAKATTKAPSITDMITAKAHEAGVNANTALKIAYCESTYRQFTEDGNVLRGEHNKADVGIFQINEEYHLAKSQSLGYDIYSTTGNIDYAIWLMQHEGTRHWHWSQPCWGAK